MKFKYLVIFLISGCALIAAIAGVIAQASKPAAKIAVLGISYQDTVGTNGALHPSFGLANVGVGERVYVSGKGGTTYTWALTPPSGSSTTLSSSSGDTVYFVPDTTGKYLVNLTAANQAGSDDTTMTINAAKYMGIGNIGGANPTIGQCGLGCHQDKIDGWEQTHHRTNALEHLDDTGENFSARCLICHTTGYNRTAKNGGFDEVADAEGWKFPDTLKPGNLDNLITNYPKTAQVGFVGCESCHGPGSAHKFRADYPLHRVEKTGIGVSLEATLCIRCHDRLSEEPIVAQGSEWKKSGHAKPTGSRNRAPCLACHTGQGFIEWNVPSTSARAIENLPTSTPEAKAYPDPVPQTCPTCHDPHDATNEHQLRKVSPVTLINGTVITDGGIGKLCMNCHHARRTPDEYATWSRYSAAFGPHGSGQTDMLAGTNGAEFSQIIPRNAHLTAVPEVCVTCHMAETPEAGSPGHNEIGEHTWKMEYQTKDGKTAYNVAACKKCHGSQVTKFSDIKASHDYDGNGKVEAAIEEVKGLKKQLAMLLPPIGIDSVTYSRARDSLFYYGKPVRLKALWNYKMVEADGSEGIHNIAYAAGLLQASIRALTTGDLAAGSIISITDVPNDQGKQVRIQWQRFPGDGQVDNAISKYGVWRRIDDMRLSKNAQKVASYEEMFKTVGNVPAGTQFVVGETAELWDFIKDVSAIGDAQYSSIAPTLFDSTKVNGMRWSVFYVSGHAKDGVTIVKSAKDSGCSVDNLEPKAPMPLVASKTAGKVTVEWAQSEDADFNYFNVYRGTTHGFNPSDGKPVANLVETKFTENLSATGKKYFYRVTAVDLGGNESTYSLEISEDNIITNINFTNASETPNDFNLAQNYPNPFNPTTTLQYALPTNAHVTLQIFDILGRQVRTLVNEYGYAGYHEVMWDGRDNNGALVSSGIYIYRIQAGKFSSTKKMILMK